MSKIMLVFSNIYHSLFSLGKNYWECDTEGKYKCSSTQTCCKSSVFSQGWACYSYVEAVCCEDDKNVCPKGTSCNLEDKTCDNKALSFLGDQVEPVMPSQPFGIVEMRAERDTQQMSLRS